MAEILCALVDEQLPFLFDFVTGIFHYNFIKQGGS